MPPLLCTNKTELSVNNYYLGANLTITICRPITLRCPSYYAMAPLPFDGHLTTVMSYRRGKHDLDPLIKNWEIQFHLPQSPYASLIHVLFHRLLHFQCGLKRIRLLIICFASGHQVICLSLLNDGFSQFPPYTYSILLTISA